MHPGGPAPGLEVRTPAAQSLALSPRPRAAPIRIPILVDGVHQGWVEVVPDGLVGVAVGELGARLVGVGWVIPDPN